jgi:hypothetical protein
VNGDVKITWDGFDHALIGFAIRCGQPPVAVYDYGKLIDVLFDRDGMEYDDAVDYVEFNLLGGWIGDQTPLILTQGLRFDE